MKNKRSMFFSSLILIGSLAFGLESFAADFHQSRLEGHESHGGQGVYQAAADRVYLLDMVEQGFEDNPYLAKDIEVNPQQLARLKIVFRDIPGAPTDIVARKMSEISRIDPLLAESLLKTMEMHLWRVVWPELVDVHDSNTPIHLGSNVLVQLAVRRVQNISISRPWWSKMSPENRAALIVHEAVYALILPRKVKRFYWEQDHEKVREIVGYLFSYSLSDRGARGLKTLFSDGFDGSRFATSNILPLGGIGRMKTFGSKSGVVRWAFSCMTGDACNWKWTSQSAPQLQVNFASHSVQEAARIVCKKWVNGETDAIPDLTIVGFTPVSPLFFTLFKDENFKYHDYVAFEMTRLFDSEGPAALVSADLSGLTKSSCEAEVGELFKSWL